MGLLAETATGFMTGLTVPDDRIIVIKSMHLEYLKQATGDMKAVASFSDEQVEFIKNNEKADIDVPVVITDEKGIETVKVKHPIAPQIGGAGFSKMRHIFLHHE